MMTASAPPRARARRRRNRRPQPFTTYFLLLLAFASASVPASASPPRRKLQQAAATGAWYCQFPRATRSNDAYTQQNCRAGCDSSGVNKNPRCCVEAVAGNVCNDEEANAARQEGVQCEPETLTDCTTTPPTAEPINTPPPSPLPALSASTTASPTIFSSTRPSRAPTRGPTFTPNVLPTQDKEKGKGDGTGKNKSRRNLHIALIAGIGGLLLALCLLFICCLSIRRSRWGRRQQQVRGQGGGGGLNNLHAPPLAVAALYYDEDDNNASTAAAAAGSPGVHNPIIYGPDGALIGQPLERPRSPLPAPSAPPSIMTTTSAVTPLPSSLSPPTSPAFDPFGIAAIDYLGLAGAWPATPTALGAATAATTTAAAAAAGGGTRTPTPPPATSSPGARQNVTRVATDGYADLMRLLVSSSSSSSSQPPSPPLLLHATDLRINPLPYRLQAHQALYRGRFGCTLPPPLPVVAVASPIAQTGSNRTIVVPVTGNSRGNNEEEEEEEQEHHTSAGVPVVVQTIYAPIPRSAASALHDELRRWKALPPHPHLLALRGVACRGDKRRLSVVWDAWPKGRTTLRAWLFPPSPPCSSDGRNVQGRVSRLSAATHNSSSSSSSRKKQQSLEARYALLGQVGRQLIDALSFLHAQGLGHGDVRPGNVWFDARTLTLKLGPPLVQVTESSALAALTRDGDDDEARSLEEEEEEAEAYRPPEGQADQAPTAAGDMYALAILLWTIWTREKPYETLGLARPELRSVGQGLRPTWGGEGGEGGGGEGGAVPLPRALEELLVEMWAAAPEARPTSAGMQQKLTALQRATG